MNPYEVLGVSPTDNEETIKKAYRNLVKKYHPDRYINNPLEDIAAEKMKEINKAYEMIGKGNVSNTSSGTGGNGYNNGQYGGNTQYTYIPTLGNVRMLLSMNRVHEAMQMLGQLPQSAEWYYLRGIANMRVGWFDQGIGDIKKAVEMEPDNQEYRQMLENIKNRNTSYNAAGSVSGCINPCTCPCCCVPCFCGC